VATGTAAVNMAAIPQTIYVDAYGSFAEEADHGGSPGAIEAGDQVTWQPNTPDAVSGLIFGATAFASDAAAQAYLQARDLQGITAIEAVAPAEVHGVKYEDRNGDGDWDGDEPPMVGVAMRLLDDFGVAVGNALTDAAGRFSFQELPAGQYTVTEAPDAGPPTTDFPVQLTLAAGDVAVARAGLADPLGPGQTERVVDDLQVGNAAESEIAIEHDGYSVVFAKLVVDDGVNRETITLVGHASVDVFFEGPAEGDADDDDADGLDEVTTRWTDLQLSGASSQGKVTVQLDPAQATWGSLEEQADAQNGSLDVAPFAASGTASAALTAYITIQVGQQVFRLSAPLLMAAVLTHKAAGPDETYASAAAVPLLAADGQPAGVSVSSLSLTPNPRHPWQNPRSRFDVNGDGLVTANDVLTVINALNSQGNLLLTPPPAPPLLPPPFLDVNGDNTVTPADVLAVINEINATGGGEIPFDVDPSSGSGASPAFSSGEGEAVMLSWDGMLDLLASDIAAASARWQVGS